MRKRKGKCFIWNVLLKKFKCLQYIHSHTSPVAMLVDLECIESCCADHIQIVREIFAWFQTGKSWTRRLVPDKLLVHVTTYNLPRQHQHRSATYFWHAPGVANAGLPCQHRDLVEPILLTFADRMIQKTWCSLLKTFGTNAYKTRESTCAAVSNWSAEDISKTVPCKFAVMCIQVS